MSSQLPVEPRWIIGGLAIVVIGALMAAEIIGVEVGITVITSTLAGLGLYERRGRKKAEKERDAK
jgi:uncharacterized membrane protein